MPTNLGQLKQYLGIWRVEAYNSDISFDIIANVGSAWKEAETRYQLVLSGFADIKWICMEKVYTYSEEQRRWRCYGKHNLKKRRCRC